MKTIVDQYNGDPLFTELHVLTRDYPAARNMLKTAQFEEQKNTVSTLPSAAFAWEDERRFPLHTPEDTLASLFYRSKCAFHVPDAVDEKLTAAAQIYKIDRSIFQPIKTAGTQPVEYALPEEKRLPLQGVAQIKMAEEILQRDMRHLSLVKRAEAFQNLFKAARRFQVQLTPTSLKLAGVTLSDTEYLRNWLDARAEAAPEETHKLAYTRLADGVKQLPRYVSERGTLVKLATTIATLDEQAGLTRFYDKKLPDPLRTVFNLEKIAEPTCDVAGKEYPLSSLMNVPRDVWEQLDTPELADLAEKGDTETFMQVFTTLPLDVKMMVRENIPNVS